MSTQKNIIVTGTSKGIGLEIVKILSGMGHRVLALSRNEKPILDLNLKAVNALAFDITREENYPILEDFIKNEFDSRVDILINNAGKLLHEKFTAIALADFKAVYEANVYGPVLMMQKCIPHMPDTGHVVNISSIGGVQGSVKFAGLSAYSSSKAALINLTELLAEEYKENGPSFNVLALGAVQTEMLEAAFPGLKAPVTAEQMGAYIADFALKGQQLYNGKLLQVGKSTP